MFIIAHLQLDSDRTLQLIHFHCCCFFFYLSWWHHHFTIITQGNQQNRSPDHTDLKVVQHRRSVQMFICSLSNKVWIEAQTVQVLSVLFTFKTYLKLKSDTDILCSCTERSLISVLFHSFSSSWNNSPFSQIFTHNFKNSHPTVQTSDSWVQFKLFSQTTHKLLTTDNMTVHTLRD